MVKLSPASISKLFCFSVLMQFKTSCSAKWYNEKFSHKSKPISVDELSKLALQSTRTASFESLLDPMLIPRVSGTPNNAKVRKYLIDHMSSLGWSIETDPFEDNTPFGKKNFENVIATLNPDAPRRLVLACHYDSKYVKEYEFIGATDSAVPCTMLLHLASALSAPLSSLKLNSHSNVTLQFIFFDGEEAFVEWGPSDSLYGSKHLAAKWEKKPYVFGGGGERTNELQRIDVMVLLDLLGAPNPKFYNFFDSSAHWHNLLVVTEGALKQNRLWAGKGSSKYFNTRRSWGGVEDDHVPFINRGVDILHVIPSPFPSVWHNEGDNRDALDFPTIENLNRIFRAFVASYLHLELS